MVFRMKRRRVSVAFPAGFLWEARVADVILCPTPEVTIIMTVAVTLTLVAASRRYLHRLLSEDVQRLLPGRCSCLVRGSLVAVLQDLSFGAMVYSTCFIVNRFGRRILVNH